MGPRQTATVSSCPERASVFQMPDWETLRCRCSLLHECPAERVECDRPKVDDKRSVSTDWLEDLAGEADGIIPAAVTTSEPIGPSPGALRSSACRSRLPGL